MSSELDSNGPHWSPYAIEAHARSNEGRIKRLEREQDTLRGEITRTRAELGEKIDDFREMVREHFQLWGDALAEDRAALANHVGECSAIRDRNASNIEALKRQVGRLSKDAEASGAWQAATAKELEHVGAATKQTLDGRRLWVRLVIGAIITTAIGSGATLLVQALTGG